MIRVIVHSRKNFYGGKLIYWYEFEFDGDFALKFDRIQHKFLRVPSTKYYEYGGTYEEAMQELTKMGITDIIEGNEF